MNVVGDFVNSVAMRCQIRPGMPFRELVNQLRTTVAEALDGQEFPLPLLVERLAPERDASRSPLFDTFFVFPNFGSSRGFASLFPGGEASDKFERGRLRLSGFPLHAAGRSV